MFLGELTHPVSRLKGIGPASTTALANLGITTVAQLLTHYPRDYENRSQAVGLAQAAREHRPANTIIRVTNHSWIGHGFKKTLKIHIEDVSGQPAVLVCFNRNFLEQKFKPGTLAVLFGTLEVKFQEIQGTAFDLEPVPEGWEWGQPVPELGGILPIYPATAGLTQGNLRKAVAAALKDYAHSIEEELPAGLLRRQAFLPLVQAFQQIHFPQTMTLAARARETLVYKEFFHLQLVVLRRSAAPKAEARPARSFPQEVRREFLARLPFALTPDQEQVLKEIEADVESPVPMARLVQGDVGSGKTLVAFLAAIPLIQAGFQVALMAPTELLALQHAENAAKLLDPVGIRIAFLSGNIKAAGRGLLLDQLAEGKIDFVVGTHALFSQDVRFKALRLVIIDEQHRFGVAQRQALMQKGEMPDLLLMSATPIPRTLALTAFGDLKVSTIKTMPAGRKPIVTHLAKLENQKKVYDFVRAELAAGRQAYFVYPLIEASEALDLRDAISMFDHLQTEVYPEFRLGLIHGRLDEGAKRQTMEEFAHGRLHILVATSVVEVGVDVANATCIVIEHAERFGLSALHQLRGRVGRSDLQSYCFLVFSGGLTEVGKERLLIMKDTSDGFQIAEADLRIRGPGDFTGVRQSGYLKLSIADFAGDAGVLVEARAEVQTLLARDPGLLEPDNQVLRRLLEKAPPFNDDLIAQ